MIVKLLTLISIFLSQPTYASDVLTAVMYSESNIIKIDVNKDWKVYYKNPGSFGEPLKAYHNNQQIDFITTLPKRISTGMFEEFAFTDTFYIKPFLSINSTNNDLYIEYTACNNVCVSGKVNVVTLEDSINNIQFPIVTEESIIMSLTDNLYIQTDYNDLIFDNSGIITKKDNGKLFLLTEPNTDKSYKAIAIKDNEAKIISVVFNPNYNVLSDHEYVPFFSIVLMAFLGGLILNLMPCVLPVLFLKIWGIVKYNNIGRAHLISTILGIFSFFIIIIVTSLTLKTIGKELGWGIQFQNEYYVLFLTLITLIFGLSFFKIINIPQISIDINKILENLKKLKLSKKTANEDDNKFESKKNKVVTNLDTIKPNDKPIENTSKIDDNKYFEYISNYFSGILACLLATPCTAPFLGSALGYTISLGYLENIVIFMSIFVGFSLPYFIMLINPKALMFLQNLSMFANKINKFMGVSLIATSLWLFTVFLYQIDILENHQTEWLPFSEKNLDEALKTDKIVFVDITAKWCITCQVNKLRVLENNEIIKLFSENDIILIRGNYTRKSKEIDDYLRKNMRKGIPFNAIYDYNNNIYILPELLTVDAIKDKINEINKNKP